MSAVVDLAVIGAGPAGLAAALMARQRGLSVTVVEARNRIGGRVVTAGFAGHAVDLGAHWLHAGPINPVVALARRQNIALRRAPLEMHLLHDGRPRMHAERLAYGAAFGRADAALSRARAEGSMDGGTDLPAAALLPFLGPWRRPVKAITGLVCGRPVSEISALDFASAEYADNLFAPGGFGGLIARLARDVVVQLGTAATQVDWSGPVLRVETSRGVIEAHSVIVTVPPLVLQNGAIRFTPALPEPTEAAIHGFRAAIYEHVVLRWPSAPFQGADRIATLTCSRLDGVGLLTRLDGTALHYLELDEPLSRALGRPRRLRAGIAVRELLGRHFGHRAISDLSVLHVSDWLADPFSRGSWSSVPPGLAHIRDDLAAPVAGRLAFAGEMTDHQQWGTVGAAWGAGERALGALGLS
jgi:monoamine oxidase